MKQKAKEILVNLLPRAKWEALGILVNLRSRKKREAWGISTLNLERSQRLKGSWWIYDFDQSERPKIPKNQRQNSSLWRLISWILMKFKIWNFLTGYLQFLILMTLIDLRTMNFQKLSSRDSFNKICILLIKLEILSKKHQDLHFEV